MHSLVHVHRLETDRRKAAKVKETLKRVSCLYEYVLVINHSRSRDTKLGEKKARRFVSYSRSFLDSTLFFASRPRHAKAGSSGSCDSRCSGSCNIFGKVYFLPQRLQRSEAYPHRDRNPLTPKRVKNLFCLILLLMPYYLRRTQHNYTITRVFV